MKILRKMKVHVNKIFAYFSLVSMLANTLAPFTAMLPVYAYAEGEGAPVEEIVVENKEKNEPKEAVEEAEDGQDLAVENEKNENEITEEASVDALEEDLVDPEAPDIIEDGGVSDYNPFNDIEEVVEVTEIPTPIEEPVVEVEEPKEEVKEYEFLAEGVDVVDSSDEDWSVDGEVAKTDEKVKLGIKYIFPLDEDVSITFKKLPKLDEDRSTLRIERVKVEDLNLPEEFKTNVEYGFDITTEGMENGEFEYDLTLPKPEGVEAEVVYIEESIEKVKEGVESEDIKVVKEEKIDQKKNSVEVEGLDHFTIYIVTGSGNGPVLSTALLNNQTKVTVSPGEMITATVKVTTFGNNTSDDWRSTEYRIGAGSWVCVDTPDHEEDITNIPESFTFSAPSAIGTYNISFRAYNLENCDGAGSNNPSSTVTLNNAITVSLVPPILHYSSSDPIALTSVSGIWTSITGGSGYNGVNSSEIRWGTPAGDQKSGLKFTNSGQQSFETDGVFYLGMLTHMNWPTNAGTAANGATLQITLDFEKPNIDNVVLDYKFDINETSNTSGSCPTWQQSTTPCDDKITFPNMYGKETFKIGDIEYTLEIVGFVKSYPEGTSVSEFITEEEKDNSAFLVGRLSSVLVEEPEIRLTKKTNGKDITEAPGESLYVGDTVTWQYIVQNSGNVTLTDIEITDNPPVDSIVCYDKEENGSVISELTLSKGAFMYCTATGTVLPVPFENTATVEGTTPEGAKVTASDTSWYTGVKAGYIEIIKNTTGGNGTFTFDSNFGINSLTTENGTASTISDRLIPGNTYSISEKDIPEGWELDKVECNKGTNTAIVVEPGETTTCTFYNKVKTGTLIVKKLLINDNGGTKEEKDFSFKVNGGDNISFESDGINEITVDAGTYTIIENAVDGYEISYDNNCSGVVVPSGGTATCTITNDDIAPSLTLVKEVNNNYGGNAKATDWTLTATGLTTISGSGGATSGTDFKAGTYTLSESGGVTGYSASNWSCDNATVNGNNQIALGLGQSTTCTITNSDIQPKLTVTKIVVGGGKGASEFDLYVNSTKVISGEQTGFNAGTYTVSEETDTDYNAVITGDCSSDGTITLALGETKSCTITNTKYGKISGYKWNDADNSDTTTNDRSPVSGWTIFIDKDGNGVLSEGDISTTTNGAGYYEFTNLLPGTYKVYEALQTGWIVLVVGSHTVELPAGGNIENVNFVNVKQGSITVIKNVDGNGDGDLDDGVDKKDSADWKWTLNDDEKTTGGKISPVNPGTYTIKEVNQDNYHFVSLECTGASDITKNENGDTATINLKSGEDVVCTYTNARNLGKLVVVKEVINDNGGTKKATDFSFKIDSEDAITFIQDGENTLKGKNDFTKYAGNSFSITEVEANQNGYTTTYNNCTDVVVKYGETATCTITNNDNTASLQLVKEVVNNNGGNAKAIDWNLKADGPTTISGNGGVTSGATFKAGTYTLSESVGPAGYGASKWSCTNNIAVNENNQITLALGQSTVCTITNDDIAPKLTLTKVIAENYGGTAKADDFKLTVGGESVLSGKSNEYKANTAYAINETVLAGYKFVSITGDAKCPSVLGGTITLDEGDDITCTITNTEIQPTLKLVKTVNNQYGGKKEISDFKLYIGNTEVTSGTSNNVDSNTEYTVKEDQLPGYRASVWGGDCSEDGKITLTSGQNATCTITNSDIAPTLKVVKKAINDNGGTATIEDFGITLTDTALNFGKGSTEKKVTTYEANPTVVSNKAYTLAEAGATGYEQKSIQCSDGQRSLDPRSFILTPGLNIVCTIVNDDIAPKLTLNKIVSNTNGGNKLESAWTLYAKQKDKIALSGKGASGDKDVVSGDTFQAGAYTLSEEGPKGYSASAWSCTSGSLSGNQITLNIGQEAVCSITNSDIAPTLKVVKEVINDNGGNATVSDFGIELNKDPLTFEHSVVNGTTTTYTSIPSVESNKKYELTEIDHKRYTEGNWSCKNNVTNAELAHPFTLLEGQGVTCTITNDDIAPVKIIATKVVCDEEQYLPDYGEGGPDITSDTAQDWVEDSNEHCWLAQDWGFQWGDDGDTNPSDSHIGEVLGWNTFGPTGDDGTATVEINDFGNTTQIKVREVLKENYIPFTYLSTNSTNDNDVSAEIYCDTDVLNYDNDDRISNPEYGKTYYCVAWNALSRGSVTVTKFNDKNGNGEFDPEEKVLKGWDIKLSPLTETTDKTETTGENGQVVFDKLLPYSYTLSETIKDGWKQTNIYCEEEDQDPVYARSAESQNGLDNDNYYQLDLSPGENKVCYIGNIEDSELLISETNDSWPNTLGIGDMFTYTIEVRAVKGPVNNVMMTNLPPKGFEPQAGTFSAISNIRGNLSTSRVAYASPGDWDLGDMDEDEVVTITYKAKVTDKVDPGIYPDVSFAQGKGMGGSNLLALSEGSGFPVDDGIVNENFVGTQVKIAVKPSLETEVDVKEEKEGEVLGASTELPATGARTIWVTLLITLASVGGLLLLVGGLGTMKKDKQKTMKKGKKALVGLLALGFVTLFSYKVYAASLVVRLSEPKSPYGDEFDLVFVTMDTENRDLVATCEVKKPGSSSFTSFGSPISIPSGHNGGSEICAVTDSVLTDEGEYKFRVIVNPGDVESNIVTLNFDGKGPDRPKYIEKEKVNDCVNKITLKTADDGETSSVRVYADDDKEIDIDDSHKIETESIGPNKKFEFEHIVSGDDCKKTWYYAVVAFDDAGNASKPRSEVITTTTTTTEEKEEETGAIPVEGGAGIVEGGAATGGEGEEEVEGTHGTEVNISEGEEGSVLGEQTSGESKGIFKSPWLWIALVGLGIVIISATKKKNN